MKKSFLIAVTILLFATIQAFSQNFKREQLKFARVQAAVAEKEDYVKSLFRERGVAYPPRAIFIRVFKEDQVLELWARGDEAQFKLIKEYEVCALSGKLGPKRKEGDLQIPEGFYYIDRFNPLSNYHLSLGVNYPNASDRILGTPPRLGGDIFIHGNCVTIGCVPITDDKIKELYIVAVEARAQGQARIPVHIFPRRLDEKGLASLQSRFKENETLVAFWRNLKESYDYFERTRRLPPFTVDRQGRYLIGDRGPGTGGRGTE